MDKYKLQFFLLEPPAGNSSHSGDFCNPIEGSATIEIVYTSATQYSSHWPHLAIEHLNVASETEKLNF